MFKIKPKLTICDSGHLGKNVKSGRRIKGGGGGCVESHAWSKSPQTDREHAFISATRGIRYGRVCFS